MEEEGVSYPYVYDSVRKKHLARRAKHAPGD